MDNKQRYCAARGCDLVVGGERADGRGRSARWTKVAWLRELVASDEYDWVVWTDLDCFFASANRDLVDVLDESADAHFTPDAGGEERRVNTGFFALKTTPWTRRFLEDVWAHNDNGEGQSDQRSFNHILDALPPAERKTHVREYDKALLNAFPRLSGAYVPTEDYEPPDQDGDETSSSRLVHFAGQFGGARNSDGATPPTMLVQFLDVLLRRHEAYLAALPETRGHARLRSADVAARHVASARRGLAPCLNAVQDYVEAPARRTPVNFLKVYEPAPGAPACDAGAALDAVRRPLATLLREGPGYPAALLCVPPDSDAEAGPDALRLDIAFPEGEAKTVRPRKQVHAVDGGLTVVAHECAALVAARGVVDAASTLWVAGPEATGELRHERLRRVAVLAAKPDDDFWSSVAARAGILDGRGAAAAQDRPRRRRGAETDARGAVS